MLFTVNRESDVPQKQIGRAAKCWFMNDKLLIPGLGTFYKKTATRTVKGFAQLLYSQQSGLNCCDQSCVKKTNKYASILSHRC